MKKFIAFALLGLFLTLGATTLFSVNADYATEKSIYDNVSVFINDAIAPDVSPKYGKASVVHASNDLVTGHYDKIAPRANSPPSQGITGV